MAAGMQVGAVDGARAADGGMGRRGGDGIHSDCPSVYAQLRRAQTLQKHIKKPTWPEFTLGAISTLQGAT